ncbi:hypothetical protein ACFQHV_01105 [Promicromonospora thailandica]|uniref:Uncharacterized protein n=1 Tax=Promicromonospora thailandica TaxID=765201 RepID=A0A9X2JWV4_9MICO|nr:hypothetical protein [Promicromonospora thailandica]MCP2265548.1 hypothetical protein [Promicromonospora thailandica]BFF17113.1 hypothetical protein GCM10025730_06340 [Promicromonospora thailandica]
MPTSPRVRAEVLSALEHCEVWADGFPTDTPESLYVLGWTDALRVALSIVDGADHVTALAQAQATARLRHYSTSYPTEENRDR